MRTLVSPTYKRQVEKRNALGFTLIEVLVVISIFAILTGMVMLGFTGADAEQRLKSEAQQIAKRIELARQYAVQRNSEWGVYIEPDTYQFAEYNRSLDEWIPMEERPFSPEPNKDPRRLRLKAEGTELPNAKQKNLPGIIAFSSGEITPFSIFIEPEWESAPWIVSSDGLSRVEVTRE